MKSKRLRASARGRECTLKIVGICNYNPETTVLAHLPHHTSGTGKKATDLSCAYACSACHDVIDGRRSTAEYQLNKDFYLRRAQVDTLEIMHNEGLIKVVA